MRGHEGPVVEALRGEVVGPETGAETERRFFISRLFIIKYEHTSAYGELCCGSAAADTFWGVPGEQQGGACAQRADEVNGQFPSLVEGQSEPSLNVFQTADVLRLSPAGIHALAEHQLVPDVSAGLTSERETYCLMLRGFGTDSRNSGVPQKSPLMSVRLS